MNRRDKPSCQQSPYYVGEFALNNFLEDNREKDTEHILETSVPAV